MGQELLTIKLFIMKNIILLSCIGLLFSSCQSNKCSGVDANASYDLGYRAVKYPDALSWFNYNDMHGNCKDYIERQNNALWKLGKEDEQIKYIDCFCMGVEDAHSGNKEFNSLHK